MGSAYDPDAGILRLRHAALSVLARLAVDPTDPSLRDHDVAPLVAELRTLRILTERGIDPPVAPLADAVRGAALRWRLRSWATGAGHGGGYGGEHAGEHWEGRWMEVLDAGRAGLWLLEPGDEGRTRVSPSTVPAMRARIAACLD